jgi:hypothetical protein
MIKRNFDRVWGQIEDMFQDFREKMESDTQRALLKVDEEVSTLRTQLQNQSPPSTRIGSGDQTFSVVLLCVCTFLVQCCPIMCLYVLSSVLPYCVSVRS